MTVQEEGAKVGAKMILLAGSLVMIVLYTGLAFLGEVGVKWTGASLLGDLRTAYKRNSM
jgi:hypothetical protein